MRDGIGLLSRFEMRTMVLICRPQFDRARSKQPPRHLKLGAGAKLPAVIRTTFCMPCACPAEARLDHDALVALGNDDEFGAALAAWLKMRARGISE